MFAPVTLPFWLFVLILVFAGMSFLSHFLFPSVRWFFRRRMERVVAQLNTRLARPITPFKLMARNDMIVRLVHDPKVVEAVAEAAAARGVPASVEHERARRYAREIVPAFSATVYFGFAARAARALTRALYRVRLGRDGAAALSELGADATVVFVMNHRSNMDYVLATYLASGRTALSYAVGEWARVWPLSALVRASGAYFIRRKSSDPLYRRVLARYVQMATEAGVTQAIFPEGGLSVDGRVGAAKLGILSYIMEAWRPDGRDVVFVPVALSYDRVFEDAVLVKAAAAGNRRFRAPILPVLWFLVRNAFRKLAGRYKRFGYAAVSLGKPVSLAGFAAEGGEPTVERLAGRIMERILDAMPVLPVPLAAAALGDTGAAEEAELQRRAEAIAEALTARGDHLGLPGGAVRARLRVGIGTLAARGLVRREGGRVEAVPGREAILAYYAAGVRQLLPEAGAPGPGGNNPADAAVPQSTGT